MTTPERVLIRRRLQQLDDKAHETKTPDLPQHDDAWVTSLVRRLSDTLRKIGGKTLS